MQINQLTHAKAQSVISAHSSVKTRSTVIPGFLRIQVGTQEFCFTSLRISFLDELLVK